MTSRSAMPYPQVIQRILIDFERVLKHPFTRRVFRCLWIGLLVYAPVLKGQGGDWELRFDEANRLYETGHFADAASLYQSLLDSGALSPALLYNAGNAYHRAQKKGEAIFQLYRALYHSPRDSDIRGALRLVRNETQGEPGQNGSANIPWHTYFSLNEWSILLAVSTWGTFMVLFVFIIRPESKHGRLPLFRGLLFLTAFCVLGTGLNWRYWFSPPRAVVVESNVPVHYGPLVESEIPFNLGDGHEVVVLDEKDEWRQIRDARGRVGWLEVKAIRTLPFQSANPAASN